MNDDQGATYWLYNILYFTLYFFVEHYRVFVRLSSNPHHPFFSLTS